ncbi:MAG: hypothetical protein H0V79_05190 [Actinobacteria bacterium]|nr:hypothetical protein [Actinomycetota bacterium]
MAASRLAVVLAVLVLAGGCGGETESPADAYKDFARAAAERDSDRVWELLSERNRRAASRSVFQGAAPKLADDYKPVAGGDVVLEAELNDRTSVVALRGESGRLSAIGAILRKEAEGWKVQLSELDLNFGSRPLDFTVNVSGDARIEVRGWVDGRGAPVQAGERTYAPIFSVGVPEELPSGTHTATVWVRVGEKTGALAWPFEQ